MSFFITPVLSTLRIVLLIEVMFQVLIENLTKVLIEVQVLCIDPKNPNNPTKIVQSLKSKTPICTLRTP